MRIDTSRTRYSESNQAAAIFDRDELRHCRMLMRRLQFLEVKVEEAGGRGVTRNSGGAAYVEWEMLALEWALTTNGYLNTNTNRKARP